MNEEILRITQGNDFRLGIHAKKLEGDSTIDVNMEDISGLVVNLVRSGVKTEMPYSYDQGDLIVEFDGSSLVCSAYGLELKGYYDSHNWRHFIAPVFQIVNRCEDSNTSDTETFDDDTHHLTITFNEGRVTYEAVIEAIEERAISTVDVNVDNNTGTPSGDGSVNGKTLTLNLYNLKGGEGDRGNGIARIEQLLESSDDGGENVWRITEDDGEETDIVLHNGHKGDSVIVGEGDLPLTHVLGDSYEKAMSQRGVTEAINSIASAISFVDVVEDGFFVVDSMNYIGFYVNETGAHAPNLVEFRD